MKFNKSLILFLLIIINFISSCLTTQTQSPLMMAASEGNTEKLVSLISSGANVNEKNKWGSTPLMLAAGNGHVELVKILIGNGANVNEVGAARQTALMLAAMEGKSDAIEVLVNDGADIHHTDLFGRTILMSAIIGGDSNCVDKLLENGADINAKDNYGRTPFFIASLTRHVEIRNLLIENKKLTINTLPMTLTEFHNKWNNQKEVPAPFKKFEHNGVFSEAYLSPSTVLMAGEASNKLYWASVALLPVKFSPASLSKFLIGVINLISATNPDLNPGERRKILEDLKFFGDKIDMSPRMDSVVVNGINYSIEVKLREGTALNFSAYKSQS